MASSKSSGSVEERLTFFSTEALPNSIKNISENSKNLTPVIEYLEQAYLTAPDQAAQEDVEKQAKTYLTDALTTVVDDINVIASNLEQFVGLQVDAVDGLTTQMALLKTKMALYKEGHGTEKFHGLRDPVSTTSGTYSRKIGEGSLSGGDTSGRLTSVLMPGVDVMAELPGMEEKESEAKKLNKSTRVPLSDRLSRLDDVGVCLDKEDSSMSAKASAVASSTVLRRSSYHKQGSFRGPNTDGSSLSEPPVDDDEVSVTSQSTTGTRKVPPPPLSSVR